MGATVAFTDILKHLAFDGLTAKEKAELKKRFQAHRRDLEEAIRAVDRGLALLDRPAPKAKPVAKKKKS